MQARYISGRHGTCRSNNTSHFLAASHPILILAHDLSFLSTCSRQANGNCFLNYLMIATTYLLSSFEFNSVRSRINRCSPTSAISFPTVVPFIQHSYSRETLVSQSLPTACSGAYMCASACLFFSSQSLNERCFISKIISEQLRAS